MGAYRKSLFTYNRWANDVVHNRLRELNQPPERATSFFNHIMAAEYLWLSRLTGEAPPLAVWPELSRTGCWERSQNAKNSQL